MDATALCAAADSEHAPAITGGPRQIPRTMGSPVPVSGRCDPHILYLDRLPTATSRAFLRCVELPLLARGRWYLAGGTALALQVGHRQSVDLDFFTPNLRVRELEPERDLVATGAWRTTYQERGTLYGVFAGAKVSFIVYPFFRPSPKRLHCGHVRILTPEDISAMKIIAISQRGRKRDFVDLYWHCTNREPLGDVFSRALRQYPQEHNVPHLIKSLAYFTDAESDPMPRCFFSVKWKDIQEYFRREARVLAQRLL